MTRAINKQSIVPSETSSESFSSALNPNVEPNSASESQNHVESITEIDQTLTPSIENISPSSSPFEKLDPTETSDAFSNTTDDNLEQPETLLSNPASEEVSPSSTIKNPNPSQDNLVSDVNLSPSETNSMEMAAPSSIPTEDLLKNTENFISTESSIEIENLNPSTTASMQNPTDSYFNEDPSSQDFDFGPTEESIVDEANTADHSLESGDLPEQNIVETATADPIPATDSIPEQTITESPNENQKYESSEPPSIVPVTSPLPPVVKKVEESVTETPVDILRPEEVTKPEELPESPVEPEEQSGGFLSNVLSFFSSDTEDKVEESEDLAVKSENVENINQIPPTEESTAHFESIAGQPSTKF